MIGALAVGVVVALAAHGTGMLSRWGALGAGAFAGSLVGLGGEAWLGPAVAFFVPSSALSFLPSGSGATGGPPRRTLRQVLANGGVAWALLGVATAAPAFASLAYAGFVGALAAAAADTWATELGVRYAGPPRSLRTGRRVAPGTSGAVSGGGTLAGVGGAASVALSALAVGGIGMATAGLCTLAGLGGMLADGWAGATVQVRYQRLGTDERSERPGPGRRLARGVAWIDNDAVNLIGTATGAVLAVLLTALAT